MRITSITGGLANLDTDGDGTADNGAVITPTRILTITVAERQQLADLFEAVQSLWRVPMTHSSPHDCNWPPGNATPPTQRPPETEDTPTDPCSEAGGSVIGCESQTLGEDVEVAGTPFRLHYESDRGPDDPPATPCGSP